ncbi:MAG: hypothetical protein JSW73_02195 [Candidatus Woesearchaeota archaeon]|nr:MAG: hypothetical protein JSW73_02195 [Candidatus Woesearchaeota archaeon]
MEQLVKRIEELNNQFYKLNKILVIPFVHLSNKIATPKKALGFVKKLEQILKKKDFNVQSLSFGTCKKFLFEIPGQPADVSYFEFPYSGKP